MKHFIAAALAASMAGFGRAFPEQAEPAGFQPFEQQQQQEGPEPDEELTQELKATIKTIKDQTQKYEELDKTTKKAFEELTTVKNGFTGLGADIQGVQLALKKVELHMHHERRMAFGDPIQRIVHDEEQRTLLNALIRKGLQQKFAGLKLSEAQQRALDTANTPGSTYINDALDRNVYDVLANYGIWNTFEVRPLSTKVTKMPVKTVRPTAAFVAEGVAITPDTAKAGTTVSATVNKGGVLLSVSNELLEDSEIDVTADVLADFGEALAYLMDWSCTQADGGADATDGGFTGIFGGGGTAAVAATGNNTMELLDFEDWTAVVIASSDIATRPLKWWMHPAILVRALHTKDGNGRPIFLTATEAPAAGNIGSILGYPVVSAQRAPSANTGSAKVAVLGDPAGARFGIRKAFEFRASDQFGFDEDAIYFRGIARFAFKVKSATAFRVLTLAA